MDVLEQPIEITYSGKFELMLNDPGQMAQKILWKQNKNPTRNVTNGATIKGFCYAELNLK